MSPAGTLDRSVGFPGHPTRDRLRVPRCAFGEKLQMKSGYLQVLNSPSANGCVVCLWQQKYELSPVTAHFDLRLLESWAIDSSEGYRIALMGDV